MRDDIDLGDKRPHYELLCHEITANHIVWLFLLALLLVVFRVPCTLITCVENFKSRIDVFPSFVFRVSYTQKKKEFHKLQRRPP